MSYKRILVIPGPFVPYNDTITLLNYKRLSHLDCYFDVIAIGGKEDVTLEQELKADPNYSKFNVIKLLDYKKMDIVHNPLNLLYFLYAFFKYRKTAINQFKKSTYDIVYSSSHPGMSHLVANYIKKNNKSVKWIASFSDPIKGSPYKKAPKNRNIFYKIAFKIGTFFYIGNFYEKVAIKNADNLIFICNEQRDFTCLQYENYKKLIKKSVIAPLSIEPGWNIYKPLLDKKKANNSKLVASHLGRIYGLRKINKFLCALKELKENNLISNNEIEFLQFGEIDLESKKYIKENNLEDMFIQKNIVDYKTSIEIIAKSDILLLFDTLLDGETIQPYLPSKIVEYLVTKKPILAIAGDNSPAHRILNHYGHLCVSNDKDTIKNNIIELLNDRYVVDYNVDDFFAEKNIAGIKEIIYD